MTGFFIWYAACAMASACFTANIERVTGAEIRHVRAAALWPVFWLLIAWRAA